jgi:7-carboxy-7-deazaguanine synthase
MYGKNAVAKSRAIADGFAVHSLFYTIQGEGPYAGYPAVFVRLGGCNLRCFWCDTEFEQGIRVLPRDALLAEIVALAGRHACRLIVVTGGEPLLQPVGALILAAPKDWRFQIETAGSVWPDGLEAALDRVDIVCSPKTPTVHPKIAAHAFAFKYIIRAGETAADDGLPERSAQIEGAAARVFRAAPGRQVFVQPCDELDPGRAAANMREAARIAMRFGHRLSLQLHKIADIP